ncbi:MAG: CGNR zinc finger domain-containing protein [Actinomycetota bacterium]
MHFAPDTEETLEFTVALCNSVAEASRSGNEELATVPELSDFLTYWTYSGRIDHTLTELAEVHETRTRLRRLWTLPRDQAVAETNAMLREANALPQLTRHDGSDWHWHATAPDAPLAERIRVEVALAMADVIRMDEGARLRVCEADDCDGLLADLSRNGSKRFCSIRCGNRMNMIAYRARA